MKDECRIRMSFRCTRAPTADEWSVLNIYINGSAFHDLTTGELELMYRVPSANFMDVVLAASRIGLLAVEEAFGHHLPVVRFTVEEPRDEEALT